MSEKVLTPEIQFEIFKEANKRLKQDKKQNPPRQVVENYAKMLEDMWLENLVTFEWENK